MRNIRMAVILSALSDDAARPSPQGIDFAHLFFTPSPGGQSISDYFIATSYGRINFAGSQVFGWVNALAPVVSRLVV